MVEGIASFTSRYPGEVWLEVLLLAGVTGIPTEAARIAALAERIGPARVQLNTVCRPPAERSARSLTDDGMRAAKALFRGHVDIIGCGRRERVEPPGPPQTRRADILALLRRRPCTAEDVAEGLHMHINEVVKALDALTMNASVTNSVVNGRLFYAAAEPTAGSET